MVATAAAADQLRSGPTRPELPLLWWCARWWFAKQIPGRLLPRRWQPLIKVWAVCVLVAASVNSVHTRHPSALALIVWAVTDLSITAIRGRREGRRVHRRMQPAGPAAATAGRAA